jgi:hypothetical protein
MKLKNKLKIFNMNKNKEKSLYCDKLSNEILAYIFSFDLKPLKYRLLKKEWKNYRYDMIQKKIDELHYVKSIVMRGICKCIIEHIGCVYKCNHCIVNKSYQKEAWKFYLIFDKEIDEYKCKCEYCEKSMKSCKLRNSREVYLKYLKNNEKEWDQIKENEMWIMKKWMSKGIMKPDD